MTIFTSSKARERKEEKECLKYEVVTEKVPEKDVENVHETETRPPTLVTLRMRRRTNCTNFCLLLTGLIIIATGLLGGLYLYKHLTHKTFRGWCGVRYYEYEEAETDNEQPEALGRRGHQRRMIKHFGKIEEQVEIDHLLGQYEKFEMPQFEECQRSTVLHDFEKNMTAIVDRDHYRCYVMPLNRTSVKPPKDFWDMLSKLSTGYYMPDVELVRSRYRVTYPQVTNLSPMGYYIWKECHRFNTYRLEQIGPNDPVAMVKRSVDAVKGGIDFAIPGSMEKLFVIHIDV